MNPKCIYNLFEVKEIMYYLRDNNRLVQPKVKTCKFGLRTIAYLGAKLWNDLPADMKDVKNMDLPDFKSILLHWAGPDMFSDYQYYV